MFKGIGSMEIYTKNLSLNSYDRFGFIISNLAGSNYLGRFQSKFALKIFSFNPEFQCNLSNTFG